MKPISTPQERLVIYEMTLKEYKSKPDFICNLLRKLSGRGGRPDYYFYQTKDYFPEFAKYHTCDAQIGDAIKYKDLYRSDVHEWRIKVLTEIINDIKKQTNG